MPKSARVKGSDVERTATQMQDAKPDCQAKLKSYALGKKVVEVDLEPTVQHKDLWVQGEAFHRGQSLKC